jgi:MFS family permease
MNHARLRVLLLLECALVYFAAGMFYILPLFLGRGGELRAAQLIGASAVGAISCSAGSAWLVRRFGLARLEPLGGAVFAAGALAFALAAWQGANTVLLFAACAVQGWGWGLCFTLGPLCLSSLSSAGERTHNLLLYGAAGSAGSGLAPLLAELVLHFAPGAFAGLFALAALCSGMAALLSRAVMRSGAAVYVPSAQAKLRYRSLLRWPGAAYYLMVALAACIYTSMVNFQATFAAAKGLHYGTFYLFYTLAVIGTRFAAGWLARGRDLARLLPALLAVALLSLGFLAAAAWSPALYAIGAFMLGTGYGLAYPIMQAQAIRHAPQGGQAAAVSLYSLSYLVPRYGFPYLAALLVLRGGYEALLAVLACCTAAALVLARLSR